MPWSDSLLALIQNLPPDAPGWPRTEWPKVKLAAMEAWGWLTTAGLIMPHPASPANCVLTRRGRDLRTEADVSRYRDDGVLPAGLLHPRIAEEVRVLFTRGHFSTAVFYAFRELEVAMRQAVQGEPQWTGQQVVRAAFNPTSGKLRNTDPEIPESEREAEFALFNGAISARKNPGSHRRVPTTRADAARLVMFASHLLFLVGERDGDAAAPGGG